MSQPRSPPPSRLHRRPGRGGCSAPRGWCAAWTSPRPGGSGSTRWPATCSRRPRMTWPTRPGPSRTPGWSAGPRSRCAATRPIATGCSCARSARRPGRAGPSAPRRWPDPAGDLVQAVAVWVAIDAADGRPVPLGDVFHRIYGPSTGGRQVSARLIPAGPAGFGPGRRWPLRASDFDTAGHVNNSIHWAVGRGCAGRPGLAAVLGRTGVPPAGAARPRPPAADRAGRWPALGMAVPRRRTAGIRGAALAEATAAEDRQLPGRI